MKKTRDQLTSELFGVLRQRQAEWTMIPKGRGQDLARQRYIDALRTLKEFFLQGTAKQQDIADNWKGAPNAL